MIFSFRYVRWDYYQRGTGITMSLIKNVVFYLYNKQVEVINKNPIIPLSCLTL